MMFISVSEEYEMDHCVAYLHDRQSLHTCPSHIILKLHTVCASFALQVWCQHRCSHWAEYLCWRWSSMALSDRAIRGFDRANSSLWTEHWYCADGRPGISSQSCWCCTPLPVDIRCPCCIPRHKADMVFRCISKVGAFFSIAVFCRS